MIIEFILNPIFAFLELVVAFIGLDFVNDFFVNNMVHFDTLFANIGFFSGVLPISHLFIALTTLILYHNAALLWSIIMWVTRKIPGIN